MKKRRKTRYAAGGRSANSAALADLEHYGEGPERQFFSGNLPPPDPISYAPPPEIPGGSKKGLSANDVLGGVVSGIGAIGKLGKVASTAGEALQGMGFDNAFTQGLETYGDKASNPLKSVYDWYKGAGGAGGAGAGAVSGAAPIAGDAALAGLGSLGTGAAFGTSGAGALGASGATAGLADLGTATAGQMFGTSASAAAGSGAGSLGGAGLGGSGAAAGAEAGAGSAAGAGAGAGSSLASYAGPAAAAYIAYFLGEGLLTGPDGIPLSQSNRSGMNNEVLRNQLPYEYYGKSQNGQDQFILPNGGVVNWDTLDQLGALLPGAKGATTRDTRGGSMDEYNALLGRTANSSNVGAYNERHQTPEEIQAQITAMGGTAQGQTNNNPLSGMEAETNAIMAQQYGYARGGTPRKAMGGYFTLGPEPEDLSGGGGFPVDLARQDAGMQFAQGGSPHSPLSSGLSDTPRYVESGPGGGRGDLIDAKLSPKEYVMDAETVALAGNGDPDEGARQLDMLRKNLRKHKGKKLAKGHFSANAKPLHHYLRNA